MSNLDELRQSLPAEAQQLPEDVIIEIVKVVAVRSQVPPASILMQYEEVVPGAADRLLTMGEKNQNHRIDMDIRESNSQRMMFAYFFVLLLVPTCLGAYLTSIGASLYHLVFYSPLVLILIYGLKSMLAGLKPMLTGFRPDSDE